MKKQFLIIALALAATSLAAQDWHYEYNDAEQTATVVSWDRWHDTDHGEAYGHDNCYEGDLVIPDKAPNGYAVTAFYAYPMPYLNLGPSIEYIGEGAFAQSAIQEITCQGTVAPVCEGWVFDGMSPLATLYIPKGAKPAYENAECWKEFFAEEKVVEFTPTAIEAVEYNGNKLSHLTSHPSSSLWYTIDGRQLSGEPSSAGIYLHDGRAVVKK